MTPELQKYYEDRFSMMASTGWTDLVDDATNMFKAVNNLAPVNTETELYYRKGQLDILQWMLTLSDSSAISYEQLLSGDNSDGF
jgi:hypothetical protein